MQHYKFSNTYLKSVELGSEFHKTHKTWAGKGTFQYTDHLLFLRKKYNATSMLDFGCGKGVQFIDNKLQNIVGCEIEGYDPCIHGLDKWPTGKWDIVYSLDAITAVDDQDMRWLFESFSTWATKAIFISSQTSNLGKSPKQDVQKNFNVSSRNLTYYKTLLSDFKGPDIWIMDDFQFILTP